jgi:hypothetical protein
MGRTTVSRQRFLQLALVGLPVWLVVVGLLAIPAYCRCGTDLPHAHALFELPGHSHASGVHHGDGHRHQHAVSMGIPDDVERVQEWSAALIWGTTLALLAPLVHFLVLGRQTPAFSSGRPLAGRRVDPPIPPPRRTGV